MFSIQLNENYEEYSEWTPNRHNHQHVNQIGSKCEKKKNTSKESTILCCSLLFFSFFKCFNATLLKDSPSMLSCTICKPLILNPLLYCLSLCSYFFILFLFNSKPIKKEYINHTPVHPHKKKQKKNICTCTKKK